MNFRARLRFQKRSDDANGDPLGPFADVFSLWADIDYQRGSESAVVNRLEGRQPAAIIVRETAQSRTITAGFCAIIDGGRRDGEVFNITAVAPAKDTGFLNLMGISGVAEG